MGKPPELVTGPLWLEDRIIAARVLLNEAEDEAMSNAPDEALVAARKAHAHLGETLRLHNPAGDPAPAPTPTRAELEAVPADPLRAVASRLREMAEHHRTEWEKHERNECFKEAALARGACLAQSAAADMVDAALLGGLQARLDAVLAECASWRREADERDAALDWPGRCSIASTLRLRADRIERIARGDS